MKILRIAGLAWADAVMEGTFFIMQNYLTDVWKLSFTSAAAFLNIWGGIYRILPIFFLFLADTVLGNFLTLALSAIFSTTGIFLITITTLPVFGNEFTGGRCRVIEEECIGPKEKALFSIGMALLALGRAARFASTDPFIEEQIFEGCSRRRCLSLSVAVLVCLPTPALGMIAFPYVNKWFVLFGVSAISTASATLFFFCGWHTFNKPGPRPEGSRITDFFRVFVAAAFKRSQPCDYTTQQQQLHVKDGEEFVSFSPSVFRFLHKAAIISGDDRTAEGRLKERSWKLCSVSEVESTKTVIRLLPIWSTFIVCGIVSSIGNTYFVEQASSMNTSIGNWRAPLQLLLLIYVFCKFALGAVISFVGMLIGKYGAIPGILLGMVFSILCTTVAAAVETHRLHAITRRGSLASAGWLVFQFGFLAELDVILEYALPAFQVAKAPTSMERYQDCFVEGVGGLGFVCAALSVYVVGKISEAGGGESWFRETLNESRLDRYYWVLAALSSVNLVVFLVLLCNYGGRRLMDPRSDPANGRFKNDAALGVLGLKKTSALGLIWRHHHLA